MKHVTDRLAAWLGGELDGPDAAAVEAHLQACPSCRREADGLRAAWTALDAVAAEVPARPASVWPAVRARTLAGNGGGWFFGRSQAARAALAGLTLAAGIVGGRLAGWQAGPREALAEDDGLAAVWLEESSWHEQSDGGLADSWLAVADDEGAGTDGATGGTR